MDALTAPKASTVRSSKAKTNGRPKLNGRSRGDHVDSKELLKLLTAVKRGDFSGRMPSDGLGIAGKIYDTLNEIFDKNEQLCSELGRISEVVGKEGKITQRAKLYNATGSWNSCISSVNTLISDLAQPTTE
ncbi:MAG: hypothetical protein H7070_04435, partial [Saprospiraceae bacterium]|nr:hypothetical protein [Pyrinomonadaceae bacterium]